MTPPQRGGGSKVKIILAIVGAVLLLCCIGGVALAVQGNIFGSSASSADVGDCLSGKSIDQSSDKFQEADLEVVKCSDGDAKYKVVGKVENKTQAEATDEVCRPFTGAELIYWEGRANEKGNRALPADQQVTAPDLGLSAGAPAPMRVQDPQVVAPRARPRLAGSGRIGLFRVPASRRVAGGGGGHQARRLPGLDVLGPSGAGLRPRGRPHRHPRPRTGGARRNRTGRVFTGDRSVTSLFAALHRAGLANSRQRQRDDGLTLHDTRIFAASAAPRPTSRRRPSGTPARLLHRESRCSVVAESGDRARRLRLGGVLAGAARRVRQARDARPVFGHGNGNGTTRPVRHRLLGCYHVSHRTPLPAGSRPRCWTSVWPGPRDGRADVG
jgi:hypothetical protein